MVSHFQGQNLSKITEKFTCRMKNFQMVAPCLNTSMVYKLVIKSMYWDLVGKLCTKEWVSLRPPNSDPFNFYVLGEFNFREEKESGDFNQVVKAKNVVMIAGGTGIAPMLQIVRDVLKDQTDNVSLR